MHMRTPIHKPADIQGQIQPRNSPSPYSSPVGAQSQENNRQLRDLLQQQPQQSTANTFRQPLPPGMIARPQRFMGPQQQQQQHQQVKSVVTVQNTQLASSVADGSTASNVSPQAGVNVQANKIPNTSANDQHPMANAPTTQSTTTAEQPQISDNFINLEAKLNHSDLEKLEEVGDDLLGDLGEDDEDEFLKSFTAEMDFNILEYADPELDALNEADQSNLLDSFVFDDTEEKEKAKRAALEKLNKANENKTAISGHLKTNISQSNEHQSNTVNPQIVSNVAQATLPNQITQLGRQPQTQQQIMMQQRCGLMSIFLYC